MEMDYFIKDTKIISIKLFSDAVKQCNYSINPYDRDEVLFFIEKEAKDPCENILGTEVWTFTVPKQKYKYKDIIIFDNIQLKDFIHPQSKIDELLIEREYYAEMHPQKVKEIDNEILFSYLPPDRTYINKELEDKIKPKILKKCFSLMNM